jgi:hypothetical protein
VASRRIEHNHMGRRNSMLRGMDASTNNQNRRKGFGAQFEKTFTDAR